MENELYHHGIKGQKWGVRRYQNKDGSLTLAGKKRALKIQNRYTEFSNNKKYHDEDGNLTYAGRKKSLKMKEQYSELTGGKQLKKFATKSKQSSSSEPRQKSIKEMSNQEIADKIERIRLENTLKSLTPEKMSAGQKFVNGMKNAAISIAKDKGTKLVGDYIDKQLRDKLGLSDKKAKTASELLREQAQDYDNRKKVDQGQRYFKEGKYAESKTKSKTESKTESSSNNEKSSNKTETWNGTVEGTGTSKARSEGEKWTSSKSKYYDDPIDAEWREVNDDSINTGRSYTQYLLEDKKYK